VTACVRPVFGENVPDDKHLAPRAAGRRMAPRIARHFSSVRSWSTSMSM
jgi:hypothetical protein